MGEVILVPSMYGQLSSRGLKTLRNHGIKIIIDLHGAPGSQVRISSGAVVIANYSFVHHRTGLTTGR